MTTQAPDPLAQVSPAEILSLSDARNIQVVGYCDLGGKPGFKMAMEVVDGRWYLYVGHLWTRGWSVLEVTDPAHPRVEHFWPGPKNTWTIQVQVAEGLLLTALERLPPAWGGDPSRPHAETAQIWDIRVPTDPRPLGHISLGGSGSHRNFWAGGRYAYLAANPAGYEQKSLVVIDMADPSAPREVGRWWMKGQAPGEEFAPGVSGASLHGPAYVLGERAYASYGGAGMVILDVADPTHPQFVSRFSVSPPFRGGLGGGGVHTALPFLSRGFAVVNGEAHEEGAEALNFAGVVDISDERNPWLMALLPTPRPSPECGFRSFVHKGGRFGPHNSHMSHGLPYLEDRQDRVYMTWFNAGLRVYDVSEPFAPAEVAHFVPPDPSVRRGLFPAKSLVSQVEDVLVDARGNIYLTDKNHGLFIVRCQPDHPGSA